MHDSNTIASNTLQQSATTTTTIVMSFLCNTCATSFATDPLRREHKHDQWHIYNLKRRMASLPPLTPEQYKQIHEPTLSSTRPTQTTDETNASIGTPADIKAGQSSSGELSEDDDVLLDPTQCIFCISTSSTTSKNLEHMSLRHGFAIPNLTTIQTDLETLISYLSLVVNKYHECLHCGHVKHSAEAVRSHMISKGHCMLNVEEGSELLDFWDTSDGGDSDEDEFEDTHADIGASVLLSKTELRLPSGLVATSRHGESSTATRSKKARAAHKQSMALTAPDSVGSDASPIDTSNRSAQHRPTGTLALQSSMGLTGLSSSQMNSLAVQQRKIDLSAFRARNKAQWTLEKMGNKVKQKHFKVGSICRSGIFIDPTMF